MSDSESKYPAAVIDLAHELVGQMNIVRRQVSAYPPGHQVIAQVAEKALQTLQYLYSLVPEVGFAIGGERLLFNAVPLESRNPAFRAYAQAFFVHGIVGHSFRPDLIAEELCLFFRLLADKPEELLRRGGVVEVMAQHGVTNVTLAMLDEELFHTREVSVSRAPSSSVDGRESPWDRLAKTLFHLTSGGPTLVDDEQLSVAMEDLVAALNADAGSDAGRLWRGEDTGGERPYDRPVADFMREMAAGAAPRGGYGEGLQQFAALLSRLQPSLRRQILQSALTVLDAPAGARPSRPLRQDLAEALEGLDGEQAISPFIQQVLQQLASRGAASEPRSGEPIAPPSKPVTSGELEELLAETQTNNYVPQDYQAVLRQLPESSRRSRALPAAVVEELLDGLHKARFERRLCWILCHLLRFSNDPEHAARLYAQLEDLLYRLIDLGDMAVLGDLYRDFGSSGAEEDSAEDSFLAPLFASADFVRSVMTRLTSASGEQRQNIFALIGQVGAPFIPLLVDRLAEEQDRSVRYKYLALLRDMGSRARDELINRLQDPRWYLVRNLITLLRDLEDPGVVHALEPLLAHPHERVRQEALKTALHFQDPRAVPALLKELGEAGEPPSLWSILLARQCRDVRVLGRLLELLVERGLSEESCTVKLRVIATLGEIGHPDALPALRRILFGINLAHPLRHRRLQGEVLESLKGYPRQAVASLVKRLSGSLRPDLGGLRRRAVELRLGARP